jgi:hypothetical protein
MLEQVLKVKNIFFLHWRFRVMYAQKWLYRILLLRKKEKNRKTNKTRMIKNRMAKKRNTYKVNMDNKQRERTRKGKQKERKDKCDK